MNEFNKQMFSSCERYLKSVCPPHPGGDAQAYLRGYEDGGNAALAVAIKAICPLCASGPPAKVGVHTYPCLYCHNITHDMTEACKAWPIYQLR